MNWRRIGAWAGMIGPILFIAVFLLQGWLQPGYDPRRMTISELALGPGGVIHVINIIILGASMLLLGRGLAAEFPNGKAARSGPILLAIVGICAIVSGIFVTEPTTMPPEQWAAHGWVHVLFSLVAFVLWPVIAVVYFRRFREEAAWHSLAGWTLLVAVITAVLFFAPSIGAAAPGLRDFFTNSPGVLQRLNVIVFNLWLAAVAHRLYEQSRSSVPADTRYQEPAGEVSNPR